MVSKLAKYIKIIENTLKLHILWLSTSGNLEFYLPFTKSQIYKGIYSRIVNISLNYMKLVFYVVQKHLNAGSLIWFSL